jgi:hypothetical protein
MSWNVAIATRKYIKSSGVNESSFSCSCDIILFYRLLENYSIEMLAGFPSILEVTQGITSKLAMDIKVTNDVGTVSIALLSGLLLIRTVY